MRRRILLLVVGMTVLVVLAFAIPLTILIRSNAFNDGVDTARKEANGIALYLRFDNASRTESQIAAYLAALDDGGRRASVELADGTLIGERPPGELADLPTPSPSRASGGTDGGNPFPGGRPDDADATPFADGRLVTVRVPVFRQQGSDPQFTVVRVYADDDELRSGQTTPLLLLGGAALFLVALGVTLGEVLTRRIVRPLVHTAETAQALAAGDVTARATTSGPDEVADVGRALNRLADRIDQLIADERETVADLSHRLRTPMTALRLDAEALRDPVEAERVGTHVTTWNGCSPR